MGTHFKNTALFFPLILNQIENSIQNVIVIFIITKAVIIYNLIRLFDLERKE